MAADYCFLLACINSPNWLVVLDVYRGYWCSVQTSVQGSRALKVKVYPSALPSRKLLQVMRFCIGAKKG